MEVDEFCRDLNGVLACCDKCRDPFADGPFHDVLHFHHAIIMTGPGNGWLLQSEAPSPAMVCSKLDGLPMAEKTMTSCPLSASRGSALEPSFYTNRQSQ